MRYSLVLGALEISSTGMLYGVYHSEDFAASSGDWSRGQTDGLLENWMAC